MANGQLTSFPAPPPLPPKNADPAPNVQSPTNTVPVTSPGTDSSTTAPSANSGTTSAGTSPAADVIPVTAATLSSMEALDDKVKLEAGDRVSFRVLEDRDDAVPRIVADTGEIDFPYIGRVQVNGRTCRDVAHQVQKLLEVDYYYQATVILGLDVIVSRPVAVQDREMVWIVGQVRQVGPQELLPGQSLTVSQVILRAGGFGDFADQRKVRLVHRGNMASPIAPGSDAEENIPQDSQIVDVKAIFQGKSTSDPIVKPKDLIIVPKRLVNF